MRRKLSASLLTLTLSATVHASQYETCGTYIVCKAGKTDNCRMYNGSTGLFDLYGSLNTQYDTTWYLGKVTIWYYTDEHVKQGFADCYYYATIPASGTFTIMRTTSSHSVNPSYDEPNEWVKIAGSTQSATECNPSKNSCHFLKVY